MGETQIVPDYPRGITFEQVWATLMESDRRMKENERQMKEAHERTEAAILETQKAQERTERTLNRALSGLSKTVGNITEHLLLPGLVEKFKKLGFTFEIINPHRIIADYEHDIHAEIDAFLENGTLAMAVEVKTTCKRSDVDYHIERMEKIRRHADFRGDTRQFAGAIAATVIDEDTRRYVLNNGFYLIEPSGDDVKIVTPEVEKKW